VSDTNPAPTVVSAVEPEVKPPAVVDNVNDHTPDPPEPPVVDKAPDPPKPDEDGLSELREMVTGLATTVSTLVDAVNGMRPDATPRKVPWTHRGGPVR